MRIAESCRSFLDRSRSSPHRHERARVTNHADLLPGVKGTSSSARFSQDLVNSYIADMGGIRHAATSLLGRRVVSL